MRDTNLLLVSCRPSAGLATNVGPSAPPTKIQPISRTSTTGSNTRGVQQAVQKAVTQCAFVDEDDEDFLPEL